MGRQELKYGKGRLIWASTWSNRIKRYDAAVAHYKAGGFYADLFYGSRVRYFDHSFDEGNKHDILTGTYMGWRKIPAGLRDRWTMLAYSMGWRR